MRAASNIHPFLFHGAKEVSKLLSIWIIFGVCSAQSSDDASTTSKQLGVLKVQREQISSQIAINGDIAETNGPLKALDSILAQHQSKLNELAGINQQLQEAKLQLEKLEKYDPDEKKPYSFLKLEALRTLLEKEQVNEELLKTESKAAGKLVDGAKEEFTEKEKNSNTVRTQKSDKSDSPLKNEAADFNLAKANLGLRKTVLELLKTRQALCVITQKQLKTKIEVYEKGVKFSVDDRETIISQLKKEHLSWLSQKRESESRIQRLIMLESNLTTNATNTRNLSESLLIGESIDIYQTLEAFFSQIADTLEEAQLQWKSRFELQSSERTNLKTLKEWKSSLDDLLDRIDAYVLAIHRKRDSFRDTMEPSQVENSELRGQDAIQAKWDAQKFLDGASAKMVDQLQTIKSPLVRFRKEIRDSIAKSTSLWNSSPTEFVREMLSYEVAEVDEKGIPISRAIFLVFLIAAGIYASFLASKLVGRYVFPILGVKPGVAVALRSIFRYLFCIVFGIVAFKLMEIPLTAFAFLGGAAAIAVGFGSQDVMNNFMSGVILLTEQPIRVGDVILLSENQCIVTHIGLRSTRLRNYQNYELIVPNTLLIEKLVTNLTLSDNLIRVAVPLVVDRTEAIQESMQLIILALKKESRIHQTMEPIVLLKEVDTYYLTFEVHFTIEFTDPMESLNAQSNILAVIGQLFPSNRNKSVEDNEDMEGSDATTFAERGDPGKLSRIQLEREIKKLQAVLVTKK